MKRRFLTILILLATLLSVFSLTGCEKGKKGVVYIHSLDDLQTAKIGVQTGTIFDAMLKEALPGCTVEYYNSNFDLIGALDAGKISAYVCDEAFGRQTVRDKDFQTILGMLNDDTYGFAFSKSAEKSTILCNQMNAFLEKAEKDGTIDSLKAVWLGTDEEKKVVDFDSLTAENGVLRFGVSTDGAEPFTYVKNGQVIGYEVDLAVRFCREYGYGIQISDYTFTGLLAAVSTGKEDFSGSCISITEERKETLMFSEPDYHGGVVIITRKPVPRYSSAEELNGKRAGMITGTAFDRFVWDVLPDTKMEYFNGYSDVLAALRADKIDFLVIDEPIAVSSTKQSDDFSIIGTLVEDHYGFIFSKNDEKSSALCSQMNEYLAKIKANGTFDRIVETYLTSPEASPDIDYESLSSENGILTFALATTIGAPYAYIQNGKYNGYEMALAVSFCREYGYGLRIFDTSFSGMLSAVSLGKSDFAGSGISITDERKESVLFSDSTYDGGIVYVVKNRDPSEKGSFFLTVAESFEKTFVREDRWKMFLSGIGVTALITVLSALLGSFLGFSLYLLYRKGAKTIGPVLDVIGEIMEKTPIVIVLMILYYIVFGKADVSAILVSIVGFMLLFSFSVLGMLKSGVTAVDYGQTEAALALGYTDRSAFLRIVFPQAVKHFMPAYKSAVISLIKDTSIVGYIAVQDLTKISDIVRSRTFEAFFPLVATALIYFLMASVLIHIIKRAEIRTDRRNRKAETILKGVKTK